MRRDSNINQFIPLHFYEVSERLPEDDSYKIVICDDGEFCFGYYFSECKVWATMDECIPIENVIAWASFSPGWVTGSESFPEKWSTQ